MISKLQQGNYYLDINVNHSRIELTTILHPTFFNQILLSFIREIYNFENNKFSNREINFQKIKLSNMIDDFKETDLNNQCTMFLYKEMLKNGHITSDQLKYNIDNFNLHSGTKELYSGARELLSTGTVTCLVGGYTLYPLEILSILDKNITKSDPGIYLFKNFDRKLYLYKTNNKDINSNIVK